MFSLSLSVGVILEVALVLAAALALLEHLVIWIFTSPSSPESAHFEQLYAGADTKPFAGCSLSILRMVGISFLSKSTECACSEKSSLTCF